MQNYDEETVQLKRTPEQQKKIEVSEFEFSEFELSELKTTNLTVLMPLSRGEQNSNFTLLYGGARFS